MTDTMAKEPSPSTQALKKRLAEQSVDVTTGAGLPRTLRLKVEKVASNASKCIRKFNLVTINKTIFHVPEKVVLVVGPTGSGKTTLINAITNYVLGVAHNEDKRFILVSEEQNRGQTESQTEGIASYTLHHQDGFRIPYSLTLIDTPGYGDTRGLAWDKQTTANIKEFFSSKGKPYAIDSISAILFVVQSGSVRLGPQEKYICGVILGLFGKDMEDNIFPVFTFSDKSKPKALEAVSEIGIPCQVFFKTNSSIVFGGQEIDDNDDDDDDEFQKQMWKNWEKTIKKLLVRLSSTDDKSLILTNEVLEERELLQCKVSGLNENIKRRIALLSNLKAEEKALEGISGAYLKEFSIINMTGQTKQNWYGYTYICTVCKRNCHMQCKVPFKAVGRLCCVIKKGTCEVCWCNVSKHEPVKFHFYYSYEEKTKMLEDSKEALKKVNTDYAVSTKSLSDKATVYEQTQKEVYYYVKKISEILQHLNNIALRPTSFSLNDYVIFLEKQEEEAGELGWRDRVQELNEIKTMIAMTKCVSLAEANMYVTSL